jgi:hypothetical protein
MLNVKQRLVGLYVLYEIFLHENVKTTPFYQLVLDLLDKAEHLHVAEQKLLNELVKSVPKIAKQTPNQYIKEAQSGSMTLIQQDLEPHRKAHAENMPKTGELNASSIITILRDQEETKSDNKQQNAVESHPSVFTLDNEELLFRELVPEMLRPVPQSNEAYLLDDVLKCGVC